MSLSNYFDKLRADVIEKERVYREVQSVNILKIIIRNLIHITL